MTRSTTEALPARFRFASGEGAGASDDLAATLQGRLRIIAIVIGATMLAFFVLISVKLLGATGDARAFAQVGRAIVGVPMLLSAFVAWWLRKGRPLAMRQLRRVEIALIAGFSTWVALWIGGAFPSLLPLLDKAPLDLGLSQAAWMSLMIVAYGLLIPAWYLARPPICRPNSARGTKRPDQRVICTAWARSATSWSPDGHRSRGAHRCR